MPTGRALSGQMVWVANRALLSSPRRYEPVLLSVVPAQEYWKQNPLVVAKKGKEDTDGARASRRQRCCNLKRPRGSRRTLRCVKIADIVKEERGGKADRVDAVHHAAVALDQIAIVLHARIAFDGRHG